MGVDIHSHLIPGIDDGSSDAAMSATFISKLCELGLEKFICTPHIFMEVYPNSADTIYPALDTLKKELQTRGVTADVSAGAEYMMDPDFDNLLKKGNLLCLKGNYVLVEMSYQVETRNVEQYIFDLNIAGFQPVLAHPERYIYYHNNFQQYRKLRERGCLLQLNLLSLSGYYGRGVRQIGLSLLKEGLIDLAGTDLHHMRHVEAITDFVQSGEAGRLIKDYTFRNREIFM